MLRGFLMDCLHVGWGVMHVCMQDDVRWEKLFLDLLGKRYAVWGAPGLAETVSDGGIAAKEEGHDG